MEVIKTRVHVGRMIFFTFTALYIICIIAQIYLAGMGTFIDAGAWGKHRIFVHLFGFNLPIIMFIFAVVGSLPWWAYWRIFGILISTFLMYLTVNINAMLPWMGPIHPILAVVLFVLSCSIFMKTWQLISKDRV